MGQISITLGVGFGDEGKGRVVSRLIEQFKKSCPYSPEQLVIRFNGGHQAGHTVIYNGKRHVFSNFGSGTLQGVPTYWSKYCTVYPISLVREYFSLTEDGIQPKLYIDPLSPVTTPYDLLMNRLENKKLGHGTCGVGFGTTIARHKKLKLFFTDIFYPTILEAKLQNIRLYYGMLDLHSLGGTTDDLKWLHETLDIFLASCEHIRNNMPDTRIPLKEILLKKEHIIFEGAQGILLDQDYGFFPNVTRSYTTSRNAVDFIMEHIHGMMHYVNIFYVTRPYHTRHGNGFMVSEEKVNLINNENETNVTNKYQGAFRTGPLAMNLLQYAMSADFNSYQKLCDTRSVMTHMVMTCADQLVDGMTKIVTEEGIVDKHIQNLAGDIITNTPVKTINFTYGPEAIVTDKQETVNDR